jgi:PAS domain S-box-containing protein
MSRINELAKAAAGHIRRLRQTFDHSRLTHLVRRGVNGDRNGAGSGLHETRAYLAEGQKLSHTGSFGWNVSNREIFWSEETFRIFGYEPAPHVTIDMVLDRVHPDDLALVQGVIDRAVAHKEAFDFEHRLQMPDGSVKHLHVVARALVDEPHRLQFAGAVMDITARKETEQALRQSERRYQSMFQAMAVSLLELDYARAGDKLRTLYKSGVVDLEPYLRNNQEATRELLREIRVLDVNDQMVALFGRGDKQELLQSVEPYWPEESWGDFITAVMASFGGDKFIGETRLRRLDGSIFDAQISMWFASEDRARGLVGVVDISTRKHAFAELEASERRYRHLFHQTPVALWQLDARPYIAMFRQLRADGVEDLSAYIDEHPEFLSNAISALIIEEVNEHAIEMFGARDRAELTDQPTHWMWRESIDTLRRSMESRWRGEETFQETTKLVTRDGRVIDALYTVARPRMFKGLPISLVSMIDLTERVRAQEQLRRMQADFFHAARVSTLGELAASIAHEINQPLASIAATSQASLRWLAQPAPNVDKLRKLTGDVISDVERASDIIGRIRTMVAGRAPEQTLLSLDDIIGEALLFLRHEVQSRGVAVSHIRALDGQKVSGDRTQLHQVIVNLAINAVQAMEQADSPRRNISIRTAAHDRATLRCSVEDSGPGIEPDNIARLFDSFFTTKDSGMGMGLRICRSIVEAHGGHLIADNDSAEGGARFSFTLPVAR